MVITRAFIFDGRSDIGGWTRKQVEVLGISWPLEAGWIDRAAGREIPDHDALTFLSLKNSSAKMKKIARNPEQLRRIQNRHKAAEQNFEDQSALEYFRHHGF